ncbi:hypothetical protein EPN29_01195 [bacterium]|nr:MAG: hypothetical protein EPN29_01195 [bacterium]
MSRPELLLLVTGCGTGVGKTWVGAGLLEAVRLRGLSVAARKPVQSYAEGDAETDADLLARATGLKAEEVCPRHRGYPVPLAPPIAAHLLGRPAYTIGELVAELDWGPAQVGLIEGAGGVRSPLAADGDTASLAQAIRPDRVILVADAGLGAIHAVRSSLDGLSGLAVTVFLNRFEATDEVHATNRSWLANQDGLEVATRVTDLTELVLAAAGGTATGGELGTRPAPHRR